MSLFTYAEAAKQLDCSVQNVHGKKEKLKEMGFLEKDIDGKDKVNTSGLNYLLEQRKRTMEQQARKQQQLSNDSSSTESSVDNLDDENGKFFSDKQFPDIHIEDSIIIKLLTKQIEELKKEKEEYKQEAIKWQDLYIAQDHHLQEAIYPKLLGSGENSDVMLKKGFWGKIFG